MDKQITTKRPAFAILSAIIFIPQLSACTTDRTAETASGEKVVNVYNWAEYIAPDPLDKFTAAYGIKVNYDLYDSSEVVDVKLLAGNSGYDVVVHSSQFSSRLTPIGVYERLDYSRLDNIRHMDQKLIEKIDIYEKTRGFVIPYHWGTSVYVYNAEMVRERLPDHPMDSADVLFDPDVISKLADCGVSWLDGPTDMFPMVLAYLGRDPNALDEESLAAAEAQLKLARPYVRYFSNQKMAMDMANKEICVAMSWSGDFATAMRRAKEAGLDLDLRYTIPKEGTGLWVDGVYIPSDARHKDNAYLFMNFLMRPEIAAGIANEVWYANSNKASWEFMSEEMRNHPAVFPDEEIFKRTFPVLSADPKMERPRTRAFARVKSGI